MVDGPESSLPPTEERKPGESVLLAHGTFQGLLRLGHARVVASAARGFAVAFWIVAGMLGVGCVSGLWAAYRATRSWTVTITLGVGAALCALAAIACGRSGTHSSLLAADLARKLLVGWPRSSAWGIMGPVEVRNISSMADQQEDG